MPQPQRLLALAIVALVLLGIATTTTNLARAGAPAQSGPPRKVIIQSTDLQALDKARRSGTLIEEYGAFSLWSLGTPQLNTLGNRSTVQPVGDGDLIYFRGSTLNPFSPNPVSSKLRQSRSNGWQQWLVQFVGPVKSEWVDDLTSLGLEIVSYIPNNAYIVWGPESALNALDNRVASASHYQFQGPYHPAYRLSPRLSAATRARTNVDAGSVVDVTVQLVTSASTSRSIQTLLGLATAQIGGVQTLGALTDVRVSLPSGYLDAVAAWPDVFNVEPYSAPVKNDEVQGQILAGNVISVSGVMSPTGPGYLNWLTGLGFPITPTLYPIVSVVDDGIDNGTNTPNHPDFYEFGSKSNPDRLIFNNDCTTDVSANGGGGHGNLNAGIIASYNISATAPALDANGYNRGIGISPFGRIAGVKIFQNSGAFDTSQCSGTEAGMVASSYNSGARLTSNSWGSSSNGAYTASSRAYDLLTRDARSSIAGNQEMLHVFSAGNDGPLANTIGDPGTAKNVLTVGATENVRDNGVADGCGNAASNNADDIATYSSRGPTDDNRIKPDIQAPGSHITGPATQDPAYSGDGVCGAGVAPQKFYPNPSSPPSQPISQTLYTWSTGTSHSAPAIAGVAQLAYNFYERTYGETPSPAMQKAMLLNTTRYLTGVGANDTLPSNSQGYGDANMSRMFDPSLQRIRVDQTVTFGTTGQVYTRTGTVDDISKPVAVTLAWTDAAGPTSGNAYVNNLNLEVTVGAQVYRGNVFNKQFSQTGGSADTRNNVESVFLPAGTTGSISVRVIAANIAGDGVPGNSDVTDQDFALIVSNATLAAGVPILQLSSVSFSEDPLLSNSNGHFEHNERIRIDITLSNVGDAPATNVVDTLSVTSGSATLISPVANFGTLAAGQSSTATGFATINPTHPCGDSLQFAHAVSFSEGAIGGSSVTSPVGIPITATFSYTGPNLPFSGPSVTATIPIAGIVNTVTDLNVSVVISHTYVEDIELVLVGPTGITTTLIANTGPDQVDLNGTVFDDEAETSITTGSGPYAGSYRPISTLSVFDGMNPNGDWKLRIRDTYSLEDNGIFRQAHLIFTMGYSCNGFGPVPSPSISPSPSASPSPTGTAKPTKSNRIAIPIALNNTQ